MKSRPIVIVLILSLGVFFASCVSYQGEIEMAQPEKEVWGNNMSHRNYGIRITEVQDKRPVKWKDENMYRTKGFVPLIFWYYTWGSGPTFTNPKNTDTKYPKNFKHLISKTLKDSNLFSPSGPYYDVSVEVLHFYGTSYQKRDFLFATFYGGSSDVSFWPAGYISMKLTVVNPKTKEVVSKKVISNTYLLNPKDKNMSTLCNAYGPVHMEKNVVHVAMTSMRRLLRRLPYEIERMIETEDKTVQVNVEKPKTFYISRLTKEYDFHECLTVEYETGNVVTGKIEKRKLPIVSKPQEWIVLPFLEGHYLNRKEYELLLNTINKKYKLSREENATCAVFHGVR